ncbi:thiamine-phosphate kinase [Halalkalibacillus halophilus]|uniref:thiamine-phosphate kinase n=1 Tax=Halalkalibacillus halophilus TaxID=392827 RepID=UPI0003FF5A57|nr:thiamine-phosphate kinase [Halalkalibacillus halophilus]
MKEFDFIQAIKPSFYYQSSVIKGIGDDAAVVQPSMAGNMVITSDSMVDGVHFTTDYMTFKDIGYRVLAANISDLIAMGSTPTYYVVNVVVPNDVSQHQLVEAIDGMKELASRYRMDLIGGDTVSGEQLMFSITAFGSVFANKKRLRSDAKVGDLIFVTGNLGEAGYGLSLLQENKQDETYFINRHKRPTPRQGFIEAQKDLTRLCLNDISDGISSELNEIAVASDVNMHIKREILPVHPNMKHLSKEGLDYFTLSAGEDFELVGTCSKEEWNILKRNCEINEVPITLIGEVTNKKNQPTVWLNNGREDLILKSNGYQHRSES